MYTKRTGRIHEKLIKVVTHGAGRWELGKVKDKVGVKLFTVYFCIFMFFLNNENILSILKIK